jgi:delta8-fatty-acid desaturase
MYIGDLEPKSKPGKYDALNRDFRELYDRLMEQGWFDTSYAYYTKKYLILLSMFCGVLYSFYLARYYDMAIFAVIASFMLGMFWQQTAFIGHDLGHNGISHSVFWDSAFGLLVGNLCMGISSAWWKYTHNVHHVRTNDLHFDPDIQHMPAIAITVEYLDKIFSKFHRAWIPPTDRITAKISSVVIRYQHYHWFITVLASRVFLYASSIIFAFVQQPKFVNGRNSSRLYMFLEQITLVLFHIWVFCLFYYCTDRPFLYHAIAYITAGILHIQIIMNHFACPVFDDIEEDNFVVHQLRSSMAISSNVYTHWFYGGLQFQVEHHLFPMMPRHNLRKVKPFILQLCKKYNLPYLENSFCGAIKDIFYVLKDVSKHADRLNRYEIHAN